MTANEASRKRRCAGFTLMEILVVLIIISVLAGVVGVSVLSKPAEARRAAARMQIQTLATAVRMYHADRHGFPPQSRGLEALVKPAPGGDGSFPQGGYLDSREVPLDPWGNPYVYLVPGRQGEPFEIISYGADGQPGGEGDNAEISSSDP